MRLTLGLALFAALAISIFGVSAQETPEEVLAEWDIPVTSGAAAGYVPDATCAMCHDDKAESFSHVAMSRSFYRPSADNVIEDFDNNSFHHLPSDRHYEMELRAGDYWFRRYKIAPDGARIHEIELKVDWILGSGNHSRIYIYQTVDGAMFELPLSWYSQESKWQMAPGFEWDRHLGVMRTVPRQCMFCHNAYPEAATGSDRLGLAEVFPRNLPEGIGCQRCHGPGSRHVGFALAGTDDIETVKRAIVNPARLSEKQLYSICYGCHMQPAVAVSGVRRFGRDAYSFRPGEVLDQFRADMDMTETNRTKSKRFEINHHPYRLEQSPCFIETGGELGCLTCHDPHVKVKPEDRAAHYRAACLGCHETDEVGLPVLKTEGASHPAISESDDCTTCHMPERRTQDVIHVTMTDHRIARNPDRESYLAPVEKKDPEIKEIDLLTDDHGLEPDEAVMMKAIAVLRATGGRSSHAVFRLGQLLQTNPHPEFEPWYELASALLKRAEYKIALQAIEQAQSRTSPHARLNEMQAVALFSSGNHEEGISALRDILALDPDQAMVRYRLAVMLMRIGKSEDATIEARKVLDLRHNHWPAWRLIGEIAVGEERYGDAVEAFKNAAAIEPEDQRVRDGLLASLKALGRSVEAARYGE